MPGYVCLTSLHAPTVTINVWITYSESMFNGETDMITKTVNQIHQIIKMWKTLLIKR
jgi:hypothetical protein